MTAVTALPPLLQSAPIAAASVDLAGRVVDVNGALLEASGYTRAEIIGQPFTAFLEPAAQTEARGRFEALVSGAIDSYRVVRRYRTRSGEQRDAEISVSLVRDGAGEPDVCLAVLYDVTEMRRTEQALRLSEARYRALVEQAPISVQILSPDGLTLQVNSAWERLWGLTLGQIASYNMLEDPQLEARGLMPYIRRAFAGEAALVPAAMYDPGETLPHTGTGEDRRRWVQAVVYPLKDEQGQVREVVLVHEDITERVRADERRRQATELLELVIQQSGEAIIVADEQGVIRVFNPAAERLHGVAGAPTPAELWPQRYRLYRLDGTPLAYEETALFRALRGELVRNDQWVVRRDDQAARHLTGTAAPLRTADGRAAGAVLIARDETDRLAAEAERERLLREAQRAHRELEAASRLKDEFLATLSHELRTPLNAVVGWARLLRMRHSDADTLHALDVIERNAVAQARLIDDLLDVSRIITGKITLHMETLDLERLGLGALETVRPAAEARGVALEWTFAPGLPSIVGDAQRLQQILWNLLSNAVKFNEPGGRVALAMDRDGSAIRITAADTGIGIPAEILPRVFDRFTQADSSSTRAHAGLGLGLAIVRHLVELHGGSVAAESTGAGGGATFRVWLPLPPGS